MLHDSRRLGVLALGLGALLLAAIAWLPSPAPVLGREAAEAPAQATVAPDHVVVEGRILYIDRISERSHPAAGLKIEVWDKDYNFPATDSKLDELVTDGSGFFRSKPIHNVDRDGPTGQIEGTQDIYLKLYTDNGTVRLFQAGTTREFVWNSYEINADKGLTRNVPSGAVFGLPPLYIMEDTPNVEALWTFVNLAEGWLYMKEQTNRDPGQVTAFWSPSSTDGPRYDPATKSIFFRNDNAGYAHVVVQQEAYALVHNLMGSFPADWNGCTEGPTRDVTGSSAAACAFIQGFATFYPLAVYGNPQFESPSINIDFDKAQAGSAGWSDGDTVAGRIAGAFWDLHEGDETEDGFDTFDASFVDIWDAFAAGKPATMAQWWAAWLAQGKDGCGALGSLFQNTIDYNSAPQVAPIPDLVLDEDTSASLDLTQFVTDAECGPDQLRFTLVDAGTREAGVRLMPTGVISVTPAANWFGETNVEVAATDGPSVVPVRFKVRVVSVNDCPTIDPPVSDPSTARYQEPIVVNLLPHGQDVEDAGYQLTWKAEIDPQDQGKLRVDGNGTSQLTFSTIGTVIEAYTARVVLVVTDRQGCETRQALKLRWDSRPNQAPFIMYDRLRREYVYPMGQTIPVDLTGVASDDEDGPEPLEWFVETPFPEGVTRNKVHSKMFEFSPDDATLIGSRRVHLRVDDSGGLSARTAITLTWQDPDVINNIPPQILRNKLLGKTAGLNATACYPLTDKATDPDDPPFSLLWFAPGADPSFVTVRGQGTRELCLTPARFNYEGCYTTPFLVADPKGGEDEHPVTTCWRTIKIVFPFISKDVRIRANSAPPR